MPNITTSDVVTAEPVMEMLSDRRSRFRQFRRAFRPDDRTGVGSNTFTYPTPDNSLDDTYGNDEIEAIEIEEGAEYPRTGLTYDGETANYSKYGLILTWSDEAVADGAFDVEADGNQQLIDALEARLDYVAFSVLDNFNNDVVVNSPANLGWEAFMEGRQALIGDGFVNREDFEVYIDSDATTTVLQDENIQGLDDTTALRIEQGSLTESDLESGLIGEAAGMPIYETNTARLGTDEAFVVDTSMYGYESERESQSVEVEREFDTDETKAKIRERLDWVPTDKDAAVKIDLSA